MAPNSVMNVFLSESRFISFFSAVFSCFGCMIEVVGLESYSSCGGSPHCAESKGQ